MEALAKSAEGEVIRLEVIQGHVNELRQGVAVTSLSPDATKQLKALLNLSEAACRSIKQDRILKALAFPDMYGRFEDVDTAHYKTFKWILESDHNRSARELFLDWLSSGNGVFHISGKLGSGKSTLMKFLCDHSRTEV